MSRNMHVPDPPVVCERSGLRAPDWRKRSDNQLHRQHAKFRSTPVTNAVLSTLSTPPPAGELYSSGKLIDSWTHFSEPVVAGGRVYVSTWDGRVYCFGLK